MISARGRALLAQLLAARSDLPRSEVLERIAELFYQWGREDEAAGRPVADAPHLQAVP